LTWQVRKAFLHSNMVFRRGAVAGAAVLAALAALAVVPQASAFNPGSAFLPKSGLSLRAARVASAPANNFLRLPKLRSGAARMAISDEPMISSGVGNPSPSCSSNRVSTIQRKETRHKSALTLAMSLLAGRRLFHYQQPGGSPYHRTPHPPTHLHIASFRTG